MCAKHKSTGFSPHYLLFGHHPHLTVDLLFGLITETPKGYAEKWAGRMIEAYRIANANRHQSSSKGEEYYDRKSKGVTLQPGDRVLVRNLSKRGGPGKLRPCWEKTIYIVKEKVGDNPVYKVSPATGSCLLRILHWNLLLQVNDLLVEPPQSSVINTPKSHKRTGKFSEPMQTIGLLQSTDASDSEEDDGMPHYWLRIRAENRENEGILPNRRVTYELQNKA